VFPAAAYFSERLWFVLDYGAL